MTRKQRLPYTRTDLLRAFRMFADPGAPSGCISPAALEKALVGVLGTSRALLLCQPDCMHAAWPHCVALAASTCCLACWAPEAQKQVL